MIGRYGVRYHLSFDVKNYRYPISYITAFIIPLSFIEICNIDHCQHHLSVASYWFYSNLLTFELLLYSQHKKEGTFFFSSLCPVTHALTNSLRSTLVSFLRLDLGDLNNVAKCVDKLQAFLGTKKIDVLVNNAGIMALPIREVKQSRAEQYSTLHLKVPCNEAYFFMKHLPRISDST